MDSLNYADLGSPMHLMVMSMPPTLLSGSQYNLIRSEPTANCSETLRL